MNKALYMAIIRLHETRKMLSKEADVHGDYHKD